MKPSMSDETVKELADNICWRFDSWVHYFSILQESTISRHIFNKHFSNFLSSLYGTKMYARWNKNVYSVVHTY